MLFKMSTLPQHTISWSRGFEPFVTRSPRSIYYILYARGLGASEAENSFGAFSAWETQIWSQ